MSETNPPLVSFVMIAWRQEEFIRAAVEGAFQQTYSPLEIILSDDCSPDGTYDILREMAEAYRGPHQVRLNHNERNLGVGGHVNRCMEMVRGELVVIAAGDDISVPHRTQTLVKAWLDSGRKAHSIYSDTEAMDQHGVKLGINRFPPAPWQDDLPRLCRTGKSGVPGCTHAWAKSVFDHFGPLNPDVVYEDGAIPMRSRLLGTVAYVPEPLVLQRRWEGCLTVPLREQDAVVNFKKQRATHAERLISLYRQWRTDLARWPNPPHALARTIDVMDSKARFTLAMQQSESRTRFRAFLAALRHPQNWPHVIHRYAICASSRVYHGWIRSRMEGK
jgi:glycosyltransferase involved in cell wall biosynthesis